MPERVKEQLAHALGRRDEHPNIDLAIRVAKSNDKDAIKELVAIAQKSPMALRYDAMKVLYEAGERSPELLVPHADVFLNLLQHKNNRIQWGAMTALSVLAHYRPNLIESHLVDIVDAMDHGSVITRDHGIYILADVGKIKKHYADCIELLLEQIQKSPVNQVPMYAEKTAEIIAPADINRLIQILQSRSDVLEIDSKRKRIEKLIRKLEKEN